MAGDHYLFIRAKDDYGKWSLYSKDTVNINDQLPSNISVQNATINNGQTECYNAADTITVAGSGTTVDILSGGGAIFIAGKKIKFKPGFSAFPGSYVNAFITTSGEYCASLPPMAPNADITFEESDDDYDIFDDGDSELKIYPNPTTGHITVDFREKATTADIKVLNFQGNQMLELECNNQNMVEFDISSLPVGMYIIVIKTQTQLITGKIIKSGS